MAGLVTAGFILHSQSNIFLHIIKTWLSPLIEIVVIFFVIKRFYLAAKKARATNNIQPDFLMHSRSIMAQVLGNEKLGNIIASEISVLYYCFIGRRDKGIDNNIKFSSYKENGIGKVLWAILFLFLIETAGSHLLLSLWSNTIAWIITSRSFYTCLQIFAHIKAVKARPIIISHDSVEIHNGLAGDAYIQFENIEKIE